MNISKSRLIQIIKEEIDNFNKIKEDIDMKVSKYERDHPGKSCNEAHGGLTHEEFNSGKKSFLTLEEQEDMISENDY